MAAHTDLLIPQGTTWSQSWEVLGYDLDDAAWQARSQVRPRVDSERVLHEFSTTVTGNVVTVSVGPEVSPLWRWLSGVYDVEIASDDGRVLRIAYGAVRVLREVTRDDE